MMEPEIVIPFGRGRKGIEISEKVVVRTADEILRENNIDANYTVGTMIEIPRACVRADEIAKKKPISSVWNQ